MNPIAHIHTAMSEKFGIPRQSGIIEELKGCIIFEPEYRDMNAVAGLSDFSHIWLLWEFEGVKKERFVPMVRPPRLGGNKKLGVFATRSPFRPNPIGLSCVKLEKISETKDGPAIYVSGVDLRDNTPIFDIKPYIPYSDCKPEAVGGFTADTEYRELNIAGGADLLKVLPDESDRVAVKKILINDPRPHYQDDPERVYGFLYGGYNIKFRVEGRDVFIVGLEIKQRL